MNGKRQWNVNDKGSLFILATGMILLGSIFAIGYFDEQAADAAKPQQNGAGKDVIENSNGFPSGIHYLLHISGKKDNFDPDPSTCSDDGGNTIFTPRNSTAGAQDEDQTISMYVNKKKGLSNLVVRDHCTEAFDGTAGQVQLPDAFENGTKITQGMWVFARALGGPDKGSDTDSNIILIPNPEVEACNLNGTAGEEDASDCFDSNGNKQEFVELGFVTKNGIYKGDPDKNGTKLYRYTTDGETPEKGKGKGAKNGLDITGLFIWSGDACTDFDEDGQITINDFDTDGNGTIEAGESGISQAQIDEAEVNAGDNDNDIIDTDAELDELIKILARDDTAGCTHVEDTWVFNILGADLVIQNHTIVNDGVSNLQIRFYPNQTTVFDPDL